MTTTQLEPGDLSTLSAFELGRLLNEIDKSMDPLTLEAIDAEKTLTEAEIRLLYFPEDLGAKASFKAARCRIKVTKLEMGALKSRQLRIQSILKSMRDA